MAKITCPGCGYHMFNVDGGRPQAPQEEAPQPSAPQEPGPDPTRLEPRADLWKDCPQCNADGQGCQQHDDCRGRIKGSYKHCYACNQGSSR